MQKNSDIILFDDTRYLKCRYSLDTDMGFLTDSDINRYRYLYRYLYIEKVFFYLYLSIYICKYQRICLDKKRVPKLSLVFLFVGYHGTSKIPTIYDA